MSLKLNHIPLFPEMFLFTDVLGEGNSVPWNGWTTEDDRAWNKCPEKSLLPGIKTGKAVLIIKIPGIKTGILAAKMYLTATNILDFFLYIF